MKSVTSSKPTLTKEDVIREVATRTGITQKDIKVVLNAFFDVTKDALTSGDIGRVPLGPVGALQLYVAPPRPAGSFTPALPSRYRMVFRPSDAVKTAVRQLPVDPEDQHTASQ